MNLVKTLKALLVIAPKKDIRYYFNGVQVIRNGDEVVFNVTDGNTLLQVRTTDLEYLDIQDDVKFVMCRQSLDVMIKSFNAKSLPTLRVDDDFNCTLGDLPVQTIDGNYPDAQRVINESSERCDEIGLDFKKLSQLSKACSMLPSAYPHGKMKVRGVMDSIAFGNTHDDYSYTGLLMPCRL